MASRALYRSRQVVQALVPRIHPDDLAVALELLTEQEARLFFGMQRRDQRHALEVTRRLSARTDDRRLLVAALLHDCGKGEVPVWLRITNVIVPSLVERMGRESAAGWRSTAYRLRHHARLGAEKADAAGCDATTVRLIRGRVRPEEAEMYEMLCAADDQS